VNLDLLIITLGRAAGEWESRPVSGELIRARMADACRDAAVRPISAAGFAHRWENLDDGQQRRFAVLVAALDVEEVGARLPALSHSAEFRDEPLERVHSLATGLGLLTVDVVRQSDVRLEELARHFCSSWEVRIADESADESARRLHEIDFSRLMAEAEAAWTSAEDRMAYLRKLQEAQEATRRPRRGKW